MRQFRVRLSLPPLIILSLLCAPLADASAAFVDTAWTRTYDSGSIGAFVLAGANGSVYMRTHQFCDWETDCRNLLRYDPAGNLLWVRYERSCCTWFQDVEPVVDDFGNVRTSGGGLELVMYSAGGDTLVHDTFPFYPRSFTLSNAGMFGSFYVSGDLNSNLRTGRYASSGDSIWLRSATLPTRGLAVAFAGGVYSAGYDGIAKYTSNGDSLWITPTSLSYYCDTWICYFHMEVDADGNVYTAGTALIAGENTDYVLSKHSTTGDSLWTRFYDGPAGGRDVLSDLVVDQNGNAIVTGYSQGTSFDIATIKFAPSGDTLWTRRYDGPDYGLDSAGAVTLDNSDHVYVTGSSYRSATERDIMTLRYSPDGDLIWAMGVAISALNDAGADIVIDADNNVLVSGFANSTDSPSRSVLVKYTQGGADLDGDGAVDSVDNCMYIPNVAQSNGDDDSHGDACDNCRTVTNEDQAITITMTGDVNRDSVITSADMIYLVNFIFKSSFLPIPCEAVGDVNCSGSVTAADIIYLGGYIFKGDASPCDVCESGLSGWSCP